jgi:hypothetical protein
VQLALSLGKLCPVPSEGHGACLELLAKVGNARRAVRVARDMQSEGGWCLMRGFINMMVLGMSSSTSATDPHVRR